MNHNELISNIQSSQKEERALYLELQKIPNDNTSIEVQKEIVSKINLISQSRIALFKQLQHVYSSLDKDLANEKMNVKDNIQILNLMEKYLKESREKILKNRDLNISNLRMSEINTYYSEKYRAQYKIIRQIILFCIPLLFLGALKNKNIIPSNLTFIIGLLIIVIGFIYIIPSILDLYSRNKMVFSEYDLPFDPNVDATTYENNESELLKKWDKDLKLLEEGECVGPACCSKGMIYDNNKELCIIDNFNKSESFLSGQSGKLVGAELTN